MLKVFEFSLLVTIPASHPQTHLHLTPTFPEIRPPTSKGKVISDLATCQRWDWSRPVEVVFFTTIMAWVRGLLSGEGALMVRQLSGEGGLWWLQVGDEDEEFRLWPGTRHTYGGLVVATCGHSPTTLGGGCGCLASRRRIQWVRLLRCVPKRKVELFFGFNLMLWKVVTSLTNVGYEVCNVDRMGLWIWKFVKWKR